MHYLSPEDGGAYLALRSAGRQWELTHNQPGEEGATHNHVHYWLGEGLSAGRKRLQGWLAQMQGQLAAVDVEGEAAYVASEDVDALMAARPTEVVRFLPGHDQRVIGPGTYRW